MAVRSCSVLEESGCGLRRFLVSVVGTEASKFDEDEAMFPIGREKSGRKSLVLSCRIQSSGFSALSKVLEVHICSKKIFRKYFDSQTKSIFLKLS